MPSRDEELRNLKSIKATLQKINDLECELEKEACLIGAQKKRSIEDYPKYVPSTYESDEMEAYNNVSTTAKVLSFLAAGVIPIVYLIREFIPFASNVFGWFEFIFLAIPPMVVGCFPLAGGAVAALMQWLAGKIWDEGMLFIPQNSVSNAKVFLISCAIGWGVWGIVTIIRRFKRTKALKKARGKDIAHRAEYDRKKKIADIEIKEQRDALAVEVANKINDIQAVIQKIKSSVKDQKKVLESIPGLAMQDKNLYTVNILITYFERGKVDSLKEAINLFDSEEREKARAAIERATQMQIELAQELALDQMQKEQQEHNEKIRQQIDKYGKEIDALIDEMKYKN